MTTITQVVRAAARTGCTLEVQGNLVTLWAPSGSAFEGEYEMLGREADPGYITKSDIYEELLDAMEDIRPKL